MKLEISKPMKIFFISVTMLLTSTILFFCIRLFGKSDLPIDKLFIESDAPESLEDKAIELSKKFANAFFDGTAFLNPEQQPVTENFRSYLMMEREKYLLDNQSPLGGKVMNLISEKAQLEINHNVNFYAVWLTVVIQTRTGEEKKVIFITRGTKY